jgi:predicted ArsR family transcriptional regulator
MEFPPEGPSGTRGRIVSLLRRGGHTVSELANALELTGNAIRAHLTALERDGLVRPTGKRPGVRKPVTIYGLTPEADRLFPRLYGPVLGHVLDAIKERSTQPELDDFIRSVGRRIALEYRPPKGARGPRDPVERAVDILKEFGGLCDSTRNNGTAVLTCSDCPLATVADGRPEVCTLMETVLAEATGVPVRQRCQNAPSPHCRFELDLADT